MRIMTIVVFAAATLMLGSVGPGSAAPAAGGAIAQTAQDTAESARYIRRKGRSCYRKCYREFVIGRRVCRTYCNWF